MPLVVVMGVSGCGKSSFGAALAEKLGLPFIEGDALHSKANIAKMSAGVPLNDEDRWPWLDKIGSELHQAATTGGAVAACSAMKRAYRDRLRKAADDPVRFVHLHGNHAELKARVSSRPDHFMPPSLLDSQLATLEIPGADEDVIRIDIETPVEHALAETLAAICAARAGSP